MTRLRRAAIIAFVIHLIAGASMAIVLSQGLETNSDFLSRLNYIVNHRVAWTFAWLTWTAAALSILYFYDSFATAHALGAFAVLLTAGAIAADITSHAIEIAVIPTLAQRILGSQTNWELFVLVHRIVVLMSGFVANTLYSLSALLLSWQSRAAYDRRVWIVGLAVAAFGFALSASALTDFTAGLLLSNIFLLPTLLFWLLLVAASTQERHLK